jgi:mycothiol synthase
MRHILKLHRDLDTNSLPQADHDYTIETFDPASSQTTMVRPK